MRVAALALVSLAVALAAAGCRRGDACDRMGQTAMQPPPPDRPDDRLAQQIRDKLMANPLLPDAPSIIVTVEGGHVMLEGWVGSVNARTLAEADAATVPGVASVNNRLFLRRP
jgi:osmotically-inducible protein OsmY